MAQVTAEEEGEEGVEAVAPRPRGQGKVWGAGGGGTRPKSQGSRSSRSSR